MSFFCVGTDKQVEKTLILKGINFIVNKDEILRKMLQFLEMWLTVAIEKNLKFIYTV